MTNILQDYSSDPAIKILVSSNPFIHDNPIPPLPVDISYLSFEPMNTGYGVCV